MTFALVPFSCHVYNTAVTSGILTNEMIWGFYAACVTHAVAYSMCTNAIIDMAKIQVSRASWFTERAMGSRFRASSCCHCCTLSQIGRGIRNLGYDGTTDFIGAPESMEMSR